jgi:SAM-dependent methyltransferase
MNNKRLLGTKELEDSPVVANCCMNRERDLHGSNGYDVELGFDPLEWLRSRLKKQTIVRWLDLCCGSGRALIQAATLSNEVGSPSIQITGVDLVGMFLPNNSSDLKLVQCSVFDYEPTERFDLVTCIHGLHYLGDKLRAIELAVSWLVNDGRFAANLDATNLCLSEPGKGHRKILRFLRDEGFEYSPAKHLLQRTGHMELQSPFRFLGADDTAGLNYTRQPVVNSFYDYEKMENGSR